MGKLGVGVLVLSPLVGFGCTAILGDFEVAAGGDGGPDSGVDGSATDGSGGDATSDGGDPDVDAAAFAFTTCGLGTPKVIEQIDDVTAGFAGALSVIRTGQSQLRVVAGKKSTGGVVVYTFDPLQNGTNGPIPTPTKIDLTGPATGQFLDARRLPLQNKVALLFLERDATMRVRVRELPDADPSVDIPVLVSKDFALPPTSTNTSGALGTYPVAGEYFWAIGAFPSAGDNYNVLVGHVVPGAGSLPTPFTLYTTTDERDTRIRDMARVGGVQYIVNDKGPDSAADKGTGFYAVPEDPTMTVPVRHLAPASGTKPFVGFGIGATPANDGLRLAVAELDFSSTNFGTLRAGTVPQAQLNATFDGTKVPLTTFTLASLTEVPGEGRARFFGDEMIWIGTPPDPLRGHGLNFIWYDTGKAFLRNKQTGAQRMLLDHMKILSSAIWVDPTSITAITANADVVFTEETIDDKSRLMYARLTCIR